MDYTEIDRPRGCQRGFLLLFRYVVSYRTGPRSFTVLTVEVAHWADVTAPVDPPWQEILYTSSTCPVSLFTSSTCSEHDKLIFLLLDCWQR
jgi:hypothetical protein